MSTVLVKRAETPAGGMVIAWGQPLDFAGNDISGNVCSTVIVRPVIGGTLGQTASQAPFQLTRAGIAATVAALDTFLAGLTAAQLDLINTQAPGGFVVSVSARAVSCPVPPGGVATLATALATVLSTGANVTQIP